MAETSESHYVPALRKGLLLLELLAERGPMTLAQVERASGLNRTMSYRLLRVMGELGYIEHDSARHVYDLGFRLLGLGAVAAERWRLSEIALPLLSAAREGKEETLTLAVLAGNRVMYLGTVHGTDGAEIVRLLTGSHAPHATSAGKAILAFLPDDERGLKVASLEPLPPFTSKTIVDTAALHEELAHTRERGYALDDEEHAAGARGVGVPVLDTHGHPVAALSAIGPAESIDLAHADRTAARLWQASHELSRQLAHAGTGAAS